MENVITTDSGEQVQASFVEDYELIKNIQLTGCNHSYIELRGRYEKVYYSICHKYLKACVSLGLKEEDILGNMDYMMFYAARTFDFSRKLKFSTWIANQARYFCLNSMRRGKKDMNTFNTSLNTTENDEEQVHKLDKEIKNGYLKREFKEDDLSFVSHMVSKIKDPVSQNILRLRYGQGRRVSWQEISATLNLNGGFCKKLHDRTLGMLKHKMVKNTCADVI